VILGVAVLFWVAGFDILYACQDYEFDKTEKLHSIPGRFGIRGALRIALICHAMMIVDLLLLWRVCPHLKIVYLVGLGAIAVLLVYEHSLVRPENLARVNRAFFHVNGVISLGLLAITVVQLLIRM
jgi:4-hydroxybenzoate polyprenyltransferase